MNAIYSTLGFVGLAAQVGVIYAFVGKPQREFRGVFFYVLILFLTSVADITAYPWPAWYIEYYYLNNTLRHLAGFGALVSLVYAASTGSSGRSGVRVKIFLGTIGVIALSLLLAGGTWPDAYMNEAARNLSFATVVLTAILWLFLIRFRAQDRRLYLVAGGLGLNMAGEAIGQSLANLSQWSPLMLDAGSLIAITSHLLCLYIWWKALRQPAEHVEKPSGSALPSHL